MKDNFEEVKNLKRILAQVYKDETWYRGIGINPSTDGYRVNVYSTRNGQKEIVVDGVSIIFHQSEKFEAL